MDLHRKVGSRLGGREAVRGTWDGDALPDGWVGTWEPT